MTFQIETSFMDQFEVHQLAHRYAVALDRSDFEEWKGLFTEDCVWQTDGRPAFVGLAEIMTVPVRLHGAFKNTFHSVTSQRYRLTETEGVGDTYCVASHIFENSFVTEGRDPIGLSIDIKLRYEDTLRKDNGRWKFSARKLIMLTRQVDQVVQFYPQGQPFLA